MRKKVRNNTNTQGLRKITQVELNFALVQKARRELRKRKGWSEILSNQK